MEGTEVTTAAIAVAACAVVAVLWTAWLANHAKAIIRREKASTFGFLIGAVAISSARQNSLDVVRDLAIEISRIRKLPHEELERAIAAAALLQAMRLDQDGRASLSDVGGEHVRELARAVAGTNAAGREAAKAALAAIEEQLAGREIGPGLAHYSPQELLEGALLLEQVATDLYARGINVKLFEADDIRALKNSGVADAVAGRVI